MFIIIQYHSSKRDLLKYNKTFTVEKTYMYSMVNTVYVINNVYTRMYVVNQAC